jgi:hypothetical protein
MNTKIKKSFAIISAAAILFSSCSSHTLITTVPVDGAKVYLNGEFVGTTPYDHSDTKIVGSRTSIRLEKEGYETVNASMTRDEEVDAGAVIGGLFFWVPFLWTMKYKPVHTYEMTPVEE